MVMCLIMDADAESIFRRLFWPCEGDEGSSWSVAVVAVGRLTGGKVIFQMCTSLVFPAVASMLLLLASFVGRRETE